MAVRIIKGDHRDSAVTLATLYCSTTDWSFGPVFYGDDLHDADERAQAFLDWLKVDPRRLEDAELESKYVTWLGQEEAQWKEKEKEEE